MARHNTAGSSDPDRLDGFHEAMNRIREKWGQDLGFG
jgi:hypothetical protein